MQKGSSSVPYNEGINPKAHARLFRVEISSHLK